MNEDIIQAAVRMCVWFNWASYVSEFIINNYIMPDWKTFQLDLSKQEDECTCTACMLKKHLGLVNVQIIEL